MARGSRGNLPFDVTSFVGRRAETRELKSALTRSRLVTLTGPGGAGKSRLALHVARQTQGRFDDGVWLIELDRLNDAALLPYALLTVLRIRDESARSPEEALVSGLAGRQLLVVLDNCEHLADGCRSLLERLLVTAPGLTVLATSRQPLEVPDEVVWPVPPLSLPDPDTMPNPRALAGAASQFEALVLLEERGSAVLPDFTLRAEDLESAVELCRRLDGNPLAIELAAARLRVLGVKEILDRLDDRFRLLTSTSPAAPTRRQSMQAVVEGSFELCSEPERLLWARASVFAGGFDLDAAGDVCAGAGLTRELVEQGLDGLVSKSIIVRQSEAGSTRFRMLETIRQYGEERLAGSGEDAQVRRQYHDYYLALAERAESEWSGPRQADWLARLRRESANLRSVLDFCLTESGEPNLGVRLAGLLWPLWLAAGYLREGKHWLDRALSAHSASDGNRARALAVDVFVTALLGSAAQCRDLVEECHTILDGSTDDTMLAVAARAAGTIEMLLGDFDAAVPWFDRSVRHLTPTSPRHTLAAVSYADLGVVHGLSGRIDQGIASCQEGRTVCEAQGEQWALSWILFVLSFLRLVKDENDDATADLRETLRIKQKFNDLLGVLQAAELLAWVAAAQGDARRAARILGANDTLWRPVGAYLLGFEPYLTRHERCVGRARVALGEKAFDDEFRAGGDMDLTRLAAFALGETAEPPQASTTRSRQSSVLTRREREVAALVANGMSNKEIAEKLVVSQRTAETHVANILTKLGFLSRAQVARWVSEQR